MHCFHSSSDLEMLEDVVTAKDAFKSEISQKIDEKVAMTCDSKVSFSSQFIVLSSSDSS